MAVEVATGESAIGLLLGSTAAVMKPSSADFPFFSVKQTGYSCTTAMQHTFEVFAIAIARYCDLESQSL